jgi:hypothetical protein
MEDKKYDLCLIVGTLYSKIGRKKIGRKKTAPRGSREHHLASAPDPGLAR